MTSKTRHRFRFAVLCCVAMAIIIAIANDGLSRPQGEESIVHELEKSIAGKEQEPAEKVFKNIKIMRGIPAGRLLRIMDRGFSPALGVGCDYCHVEGAWASDSLETKQVARKMWTLVGSINKDLKTIRADASVNCSTCHRGSPKPDVKR
jgi:Photosynthetic reaction centre cytochrome C subunit